MSESPLPAYTDWCWPVDTSCVSDWDDTNDDEDETPKYSADDKARAVSMAGQAMRLLTGFRVGGCPITVRPAVEGCTVRTWRTYPVSGGSDAPWTPVSFGGEWLNIGCGHASACGCLGTREVRLYGPASSVSQVLVDGVVLDSSAYRLDPGGRLVRTDGDTWPLCQNLAAPDTEPGTWSVTYTPGAAVDRNGAVAAGVLAGQFVRSCAGGDCDLPDNVTTIVRSGITLTLGVGAFPGGRTGIREVDAYLEFWNPNAITSPPVAWSPDIARPRRVATSTVPPVEDGGGPSGDGSVPLDGGTP